MPSIPISNENRTLEARLESAPKAQISKAATGRASVNIYLSEQRLKGNGLKAIARGRAKNLKAWAAETKPTAQPYKCFTIIGLLNSKGQRQYRFACLYSGEYFTGQFNEAQRDLIMRLFDDWPINTPCPADAWDLILEALLGDGGALY
jgi:hypothetical protein